MHCKLPKWYQSHCTWDTTFCIMVNSWVRGIYRESVITNLSNMCILKCHQESLKKRRKKNIKQIGVQVVSCKLQLGHMQAIFYLYQQRSVKTEPFRKENSQNKKATYTIEKCLPRNVWYSQVTVAARIRQQTVKTKYGNVEFSWF